MDAFPWQEREGAPSLTFVTHIRRSWQEREHRAERLHREPRDGPADHGRALPAHGTGLEPLVRLPRKALSDEALKEYELDTGGYGTW